MKLKTQAAVYTTQLQVPKLSGSPFATHNIVPARFLVTAIQMQIFYAQAELN